MYLPIFIHQLIWTMRVLLITQIQTLERSNQPFQSGTDEAKKESQAGKVAFVKAQNFKK